MLNINSPTVQAMMQNTPQGFGNMSVYYGNTPSMDSTIQTPYPSPKEMLMQSGQQNVYAPVQFQSPVYSSQPQYVGGYNPGFDAAFAGYSNPYMGYGYSGYTGYGYNGYGYPQMVPLDPDAQIVYQMAQENGISFKDQLEMESNMYKQLSRITSKYLNRSEEDTVKHEKMFDIYNKFEQPQQQPQNYYSPIPNMHICIKVGTEIVSDIPSGSISYYNRSAWVQKLIIDDINTTSMLSNRYSQMHANAIERKFDDVDLVDFFNNCIGTLITDDLEYRLNMQRMTRSAESYNREKFCRLLNNNGIKSRYNKDAVERYVGRYGIMPDGRPVSPGHDPAIAQSFAINPKTGQLEITAPNFISNRIEQARQSFIRSIE